MNRSIVPTDQELEQIEVLLNEVGRPNDISFRLIEAIRLQQAQLLELHRRQSIAWYTSPAFITAVGLNDGIPSKVLYCLQEGHISKRKAAEALAECLHGGAEEVRLPPELRDPVFTDDEIPGEVVIGLRNEIGHLRAELDQFRVWLAQELEADGGLGAISDDPITTCLTIARARIDTLRNQLRQELSRTRPIEELLRWRVGFPNEADS